MIKLLSILGLFIFIVSCSTAAFQPQNQLAAIETWSGYAIGRGAECSDAEVEIKVLEDFSIIGTAQSTERLVIIQLRGKLDADRGFVVSGSGGGRIHVTYEGIIKGDSGSGKWDADVGSHGTCGGTWKLAKNN